MLAIEQKLGNILNSGGGWGKAKEGKYILGKYKCIYCHLDLSFSMLSKNGMQ